MFNKIFYIFLLILVLLLLFETNKKDNFNNVDNEQDDQSTKLKSESEEITINKNYIPKIIHQTAPKDHEKWNQIWYECHNTWKDHFPSNEYTHMMWHDEDLDNFVKNEYAWFYPIFKNYDANIKRIDIARYFILHKYGGIYADMDYMCTENFYDKIPKNIISISESPHKENEYIQNALMISPPENEFWMKVIRRAIERTDDPSVLYSTGPKLLTDVYFDNAKEINVLPEKIYNPKYGTLDFDSPDVITKHVGSKSWA
jgi:mannosyltransferase OCH1-like enzyme